MNRKIKFRAKRVDKNEWAYGGLVEADDFCIIDQRNELYTEREYNFRGDTHFFQLSGVKCDKNTIGQFTGLHDKNSKEIYEGDYISIIYKYDDIVNGGVQPDQDCICNGVVVYMPEFACYGLRLYKTEYPLLESFQENPYLTLPLIEFDLVADGIDVLGNIYDNPELLNK